MDETKEEKRRRQNRESQARWRATHKAEQAERTKAWMAKNVDKVRESGRARSARWRALHADE